MAVSSGSSGTRWMRRTTGTTDGRPSRTELSFRSACGVSELPTAPPCHIKMSTETCHVKGTGVSEVEGKWLCAAGTSKDCK